jgi:proline iminopeptidase
VFALGIVACDAPTDRDEGAHDSTSMRAAESGANVPINGTELFVRRVGQGEPVIVIHGGPVLDHGYLFRHLLDLADSHQLVFYDQRLSGRSLGRVDSASVRLQTFVDDIDVLRSVLEFEKVHVLAHSWGGLLALHYALRYPTRVGSLVLVSPMPPSADLWQREQAAVASLMTPEDSVELFRARSTEAFRRGEPGAVEAALIASFRTQFYDRAEVERLELYVPVDYMARSRQFFYLSPDLLSYDLTGELATISAPTLILFGAAEPAAELSGAVLDSSIPGSSLVVIERSGHFSFIERPEAFGAAVVPFLRQHPLDPSGDAS